MNLPPLPQEAYEYGEKHTAPIPAVGGLTPCKHTNIKFENTANGNCLRCECGAVFVGPNLNELYKILKSC